MGEWESVEAVPDFEIRPKSAMRIKAEKTVDLFSESKDTCWRNIYEGWEHGCYNDVEKEMNSMAATLRAIIKDKKLNIKVNKRKDAIYMTKEA